MENTWLISVTLYLIVCISFNCAQPQDDEKLHESQIPPPADQPSADQVKAELAKLFTQADANSDGKLNIEEVKQWIDKIHHEIVEENVDRQWVYYEPVMQEVHSWAEYKPVEKEVLSWDSYRNRSFPDSMMNDPNTPEEQRETWKNMLLRSERRWHLSDRNNDSILVKEEFKDFVHPEESNSDEVKGVLVLEALEDMDHDRNELINLEEYMAHLKAGTPEEERADPEWDEVQKSHFITVLDKNKDGSLDKEELKHWLSPSTDRHLEEAERLVVSADADRDQHLTVEEMVESYNNFFSLIPPKFWEKYYAYEHAGQEGHDEL